MDESAIDKAIARASQLMNSDYFNKLVESKSRGISIKGGTNDSIMDLESKIFGSHSQPTKKDENQLLENRQELTNNIRESLDNMPPMQINDVSYNIPSYTNSGSVPTNQSNNIDYNYIKYLIEDAIKKHLNEKEEQYLKGIKICSGKKIQLLDTSGNLYEGDLVFKKKIKKQ